MDLVEILGSQQQATNEAKIPHIIEEESSESEDSQADNESSEEEIKDEIPAVQSMRSGRQVKKPRRYLD
jgi:hypothetical protein